MANWRTFILLEMSRTEQKIYYILRIAAAMCFIGHGAFGIITKGIWCNYFAIFGISHQLAYQLMPILGSLDILMGISLLFYPTKIVIIWLVVWGLITAALRPLSGEPFAEFIERAGNYGAPMTLLILNIPSKRIWLRLRPVYSSYNISERRLKQIRLCLQFIVFLLLAGHGWLNIIGKRSLLDQYVSLGFHDVNLVAKVVGVIELVMAVFTMITPVKSLLLIVLFWKICSELFYPHFRLFEWIERGGSYGVILALFFIMMPNTPFNKKKEYKIRIVTD